MCHKNVSSPSQAWAQVPSTVPGPEQTLSVCGVLAGPVVFSLSTGILSGPMDTVVSICPAPPLCSPGPMACFFGKKLEDVVGRPWGAGSLTL